MHAVNARRPSELARSLAMPMVRELRTGQATLALDAGVVANVAFLLSVAWVWAMLVSDQMPCVLGVPNCD